MTHDTDTRTMRNFKQFPARKRAGVMVPIRDRRAAALGICLYTASRPSVLRVQQLAFSVARTFGTRALPGAREAWSPSIGADDWQDLLRSWSRDIGAFDTFAVYRRRDSLRTGLTLLLVNEGRPIAVVKVRDDFESLALEQRALSVVRRAGLGQVKVPTPIAVDRGTSGLAWSAQSAVFDAPHRPALDAPPDLFARISDALSPVVDGGPGQVAAHNDLSPWNLRADRAGQLWLFDWEDIGVAPPDSDRVYFTASSFALGGPQRALSDVSAESVDRWRQIVLARRVESRADEKLIGGILRFLDLASVAG